MTLADKCKYARKRLKLTQREFGAIIGTNQTEISFIERGFTPEDARKIARADALYNAATYEERRRGNERG